MKHMELRDYVKQYCGNRYTAFQEKSKNFSETFEQTAYHDVTTWYDPENDIEIEERFYIGD